MTEHYYSEKQTSKLNPRTFKARILGNNLTFGTGSGVFSADFIDKGTMLLIEKAIVFDKWRILDIGCGYGAVGISIVRAYPDIKVVMTDVNKRAVALAKKNCEVNNVKCDVLQGDLYANVTGKFDSILTNPPQNAGKKVCFEIIEGAYTFLKKNGVLQLVARHKKGGKSLSEKMMEVFGNCQDIGKKSGYRVYVSKH